MVIPPVPRVQSGNPHPHPQSFPTLFLTNVCDLPDFSLVFVHVVHFSWIIELSSSTGIHTSVVLEYFWYSGRSEHSDGDTPETVVSDTRVGRGSCDWRHILRPSSLCLLWFPPVSHFFLFWGVSIGVLISLGLIDKRFMPLWVVYYESIKRELKTSPIYERRCDERLKTKDEESTRLTYTGLLVELQHLNIKTTLIDEKFASVMGEYVFLKWWVPHLN